MFHVVILDSHLQRGIIHESDSASVCLPGMDGEFEILDFHKSLITRLKQGTILIDHSKEIAISGGVAKVNHQNLVAFVDLEEPSNA